MTRNEFYRYKMAFRLDGKFNPIHYGEKLTQQYFVDAFIKSERDRIEWIRVS